MPLSKKQQSWERTAACSDETTDLTTGVKVSYRLPWSVKLREVRASLATAATGGALLTVDIKKGGVSILSTLLTINSGATTSVGAAIPAVISNASLNEESEITIEITQVGNVTAGKGLKVALIGTIAAAYSPFIQAFGGVVTTVGNQKIHTYNSSGQLLITSIGDGLQTAWLLLVGGGGGGAGGVNNGDGTGGGGAGGVIEDLAWVPTVGNHAAVVGAGGIKGIGAMAVNAGVVATNGGNSTFDVYTAVGGGAGGYQNVAGSVGGSGGGGGSITDNPGGLGTVAQGNDGGPGVAANPFRGGGGGGSGAIGDDGAVTGDGGVGLSNSISGAAVFYAAGGGGGAIVGLSNGGNGGVGGGGHGGGTSTGKHGTSGTTARGSGGGGGAWDGGTQPGGNGGNGGSGVFIFRYQYQY